MWPSAIPVFSVENDAAGPRRIPAKCSSAPGPISKPQRSFLLVARSPPRRGSAGGPGRGWHLLFAGATGRIRRNRLAARPQRRRRGLANCKNIVPSPWSTWYSRRADTVLRVDERHAALLDLKPARRNDQRGPFENHESTRVVGLSFLSWPIKCLINPDAILDRRPACRPNSGGRESTAWHPREPRGWNVSTQIPPLRPVARPAVVTGRTMPPAVGGSPSARSVYAVVFAHAAYALAEDEP